MDEPLTELENELKRLRPRRMSPEWSARVERELSSDRPVRRYATATSLRSWKWMAWSVAGAAAALAMSFVLSRPRASAPVAPATNLAAAVPPQTATKSTNRYEPVRASSVLYDLKDDGVGYLPDKTPARQVRYRYLDTYTWQNPTTKASLRWSVPRDEVRLVRASLD